MDLAKAISDALLPRSRAWHEIWLGETRVAGAEEEPLYGPTYLPRKFKIAIAVPPHNDVDVFAHDLGLIAIVREGAIVGYDVAVGGGMGMTHGERDTFPRLGTLIGHVAPGDAVALAAAVVMAQRDHGNRAVRKHARLKYTIERMGPDAFRAEVERHLGHALAPARGAAFTGTGDPIGWARAADGTWSYGLFVENGRVAGRTMAGLRAIANVHAGAFVMTANQNLLIAGIADADRPGIAALLAAHGLDAAPGALRVNSMACVALPTCGLALAESERALPALITQLEQALADANLADAPIVLRMTGCPNGCARPYLAEIALVGRGPGRYHLYLGAAPDGTRLNRLYRRDVTGPETVAVLRPLFQAYAATRTPGERFGDWTIRTGVIAPTHDGRDFHPEDSQ